MISDLIKEHNNLVKLTHKFNEFFKYYGDRILVITIILEIVAFIALFAAEHIFQN